MTAVTPHPYPHGRQRLLPLLWCCFVLLPPSGLAQTSDSLDFASGQALFEKNWVSAPASTKASDGLGPYYNAHSCAACHPGGGQGQFPAALVLVLDNDPVYGRQLQPHAIAGLAGEGKLSFRTELKKAGAMALDASTYTLTDLQFGPLAHSGSLRLAPALQGVAMFERVSEQARRALADPNDANHDGISGRLAGRYGWKGETNTLVQQVGKALAFDMGLGNRQFPSPYGDCTATETLCRQQAAGAEPGELEAPDTVVDLLVAYLQGLGAPPPTQAVDPNDVALFTTLGCAACHVRELPTNSLPLHAWTDLLVHDMGAGLAAPRGAAAMPGQSAPATAREWRTAPLWGISERPRFLHDGRANTLKAAILWHGGEAEASKKAFSEATKLQQEHLLAFLRGL